VRAGHERALVKSVQSLLRKRPDIIVRRTDKSKVFYVSNTVNFARKAANYMVKGCPISSDPIRILTITFFLFNP
jgi:hypothetical protein